MPDDLPADLETRLEGRGCVVYFEAGDVAGRAAVDDPVGGAGGVVGFVAELAHEEVEEPHDGSGVFLFLLVDFGTGYFVGDLVGREWVVFKCWLSLAHYLSLGRVRSGMSHAELGTEAVGASLYAIIGTGLNLL